MSNVDYLITQFMLISMLVFLVASTVVIIYCGLTTKSNHRYVYMPRIGTTRHSESISD